METSGHVSHGIGQVRLEETSALKEVRRGRYMMRIEGNSREGRTYRNGDGEGRRFFLWEGDAYRQETKTPEAGVSVGLSLRKALKSRGKKELTCAQRTSVELNVNPGRDF